MKPSSDHSKWGLNLISCVGHVWLLAAWADSIFTSTLSVMFANQCDIPNQKFLIKKKWRANE